MKKMSYSCPQCGQDEVYYLGVAINNTRFIQCQACFKKFDDSNTSSHSPTAEASDLSPDK